MNKIEQLLQEHCPNGVEWKPLGEVAAFYGGLTGKSKADFEEGNALFIPYKNIFNNIQIDFSKLEKVKIEPSETQNTVKYGDVLFTGSSETVDEAGMSSAITMNIEDNVYLNSFSFGIRFHCDINLLPAFSKYLFRSHFMRTAISKTASGVTRFNISKERFKNILIPLPPLPVQEEIVRILDKFTTLEAELEAELDCRKRQYMYYRNKLLNFDDRTDVVWKSLGEVALKIYSGGTPKTGHTEYWTNGTIPWMSSGEVNLGTVYKTEKFITEEGLLNSSAKYVPANSLVIALAGQGKTRGKVARIKIELTTNQSLAALTFDNNKINSDYVYHYMVTQYEKLRQISSGNGTRGGLNLQMISNFSIPIPYPDDIEKSLEEQARIVSILDKFDTLTTSISEGLPKEIELRRKQYEYYRDQLLSFPKHEVKV